jgi:hypothetical protein
MRGMVSGPLVTYFEKSELLLAAPDRKTAQGRRDYAVILFPYNTGAHLLREEDTCGGRVADRVRTHALCR